ncbi:MAG: hypothetical protein WAM30_18255 [Candidatus Dormiibacterota bacterium]
MRGRAMAGTRGLRQTSDPLTESGLQLYDEAMVALEDEGGRAAVGERVTRLRVLATAAGSEDGEELTGLADALERELRPDAWTPLAEAEELVGWVREPELDRQERSARETIALDRLAALPADDAAQRRSIAVLGRWVMMLHERDLL